MYNKLCNTIVLLKKNKWDIINDIKVKEAI